MEALPSSGKQCLPVMTGQRLPAIQPQPAWPDREAVIAFRFQWPPQGLEAVGQGLVRGKLYPFAKVPPLADVRETGRGLHGQLWVAGAVGQPGPIVYPLDFLQGCFPAQRTISTFRQRAGADVGDVPLAVLL